VRRLLAGAAVAGLGVLLCAPPAFAANPSTYDGSHITTPTQVDTSSPVIGAVIVRKAGANERVDVGTYFTTPDGLPDGCGPAGEKQLPTSTAPNGEPNALQSTAVGSAPCNGTYGIRIEATLTNRILGIKVDSATYPGSVQVAEPPANVSGVEGALDGTSVVLSWSRASGPAPDFKGYRIERRDGDGWTKLDTVGTNTSTFTDTTPPPEGGEISYRVLGRRSGPNGEVLSGGGGRVTVSVPVPTTTTPVTNPDGTPVTTVPGSSGSGGSGGTGSGGSGGTGSGGTGGTGTDGGRAPSRTGRTFNTVPRGTVGIGTKAPRIGTPQVSNIPDLTVGDNGFNETLDYGDQQLADGSEDGQDGLSSIYYGGAGGKGMAVPVATGFVLAAWAFHLRYLARAAKPAAKPAKRRRPVQPRGGWA
jgi:hypothetical protein